MLKHLAVAFLFLSSLPLMAQQPVSGINQLTFHQAEYNKAFVGNGFLIEYDNQTYAVTVKHALLEAKTPNMTSVDIAPHIQEWRIHPNGNEDQYVILGKLLNSNSSEAIDMKILSKDWLVFEVKENKSNLKVLPLRQSKVTQGEQLTAYGCSYANQSSCQQDKYQGTFIDYEANNLRVDMPNLDLSKLRGLSGSPVLDSNNQVVGIVSNILPKKQGKGFDFAPASLVYLKEVLNRLS